MLRLTVFHRRFFLDPECFKIETKIKTTSDITAPFSESNDSTNNSSSSESLLINTTADTISDLVHSTRIHNGNENGRTDLTSIKIYHTIYPESFSNQDWSIFIKQYVRISLLIISIYRFYIEKC